MKRNPKVSCILQTDRVPSSLIALRPISSMKYEETTRQTVMGTPEKVSESIFWYLLLNAVQFCGVPGEMEGLCLGNRHRWRGHPIGRLACSRFGTSKETARLIPSRHIQTKPSQTCRQNCQCSVEVLFKFINLYRNSQNSLWWQQARKVKVMFGARLSKWVKLAGFTSKSQGGTAYQPWNRKIPKSLEDMRNFYNSFFKVHDQVSHQFARCCISSTPCFGALLTEVGPCVDQSQPTASSVKTFHVRRPQINQVEVNIHLHFFSKSNSSTNMVVLIWYMMIYAYMYLLSNYIFNQKPEVLCYWYSGKRSVQSSSPCKLPKLWKSDSPQPPHSKMRLEEGLCTSRRVGYSWQTAGWRHFVPL